LKREEVAALSSSLIAALLCELSSGDQAHFFASDTESAHKPLTAIVVKLMRDFRKVVFHTHADLSVHSMRFVVVLALQPSSHGLVGLVLSNSLLGG